MIFKRFMTFGMLIALVLIPLFSLTVDAQTYFSDDFENPAESEDKWEVITGDWQVADGVYHQLSTADPWQASMVAADKWDDEWVEYTIEFMVKPLTQGDAPVNVLFRVQDPVPQIWSDRNGPNTHMYRWIVNGWTNTESRPYMYNAGTSEMLAQTNNSLEVGNWHNIKLVVTKTSLAGYVDDVEMFNVDHAEWTDGRVGIQAYSGIMDFDDFIVYGPGPYVLSPNPPDGAIHPDTWVSLGWSPGAYAVSHDVYLGDNFDDVEEATRDSDVFRGNQDTVYYVAGFPGYAYPDGLVPGTTYYWRIDEVNDTEPNSPWKGPVWSFSVPPKTAYYPDPADGAEFIDLNVQLKWTAGFGAKLHYIVFGEDFDEVNNAAADVPNGTVDYTPGPLKLAKTYYWRIDEFDGAGTYKGEVWSFTTEGAVSGPNPADGSVDVKPTVILSWDAGAVADSHEVYFGTDADAVANATTTSPEYKGPKVLGEENYDPGKLMLSTAYYWRIDEVNGVNPNSPWVGNVWNFTTGDFFVIDDFEGYDAGENQIWYAWHDGLGYGAPGTDPYFTGNGSGAAVGYETTASYTEETIVHSGDQSMPLAYDNNKQGYAFYSEVKHTLTVQRDWTEEGVVELSLWFYGDPNNSNELLYVAVSNSAGTPAVVVHEDLAAATIDTWTEWVIPLQAFADQGIILTNVDRIAIGLGTKGNMTIPGGSGKMFFDDIRLYLPREVAEE
ncbi:MAG: hypothetical protein WBC05_11890 [Sedimentisphaerales bacterium]